jgi:hypothetical protein
MTVPTILSIRVDESLYFANARVLADAVYDHIAGQSALKRTNFLWVTSFVAVQGGQRAVRTPIGALRANSGFWLFQVVFASRLHGIDANIQHQRFANLRFAINPSS